MASRGKGARQKGFQFERDMAKVFTDKLGIEFQRGLGQSRDGGAEAPDIMPTDNQKLFDRIQIECKRQARTNIKAAIKQAENDIEKRKAKKANPIAITKEDREDILVTIKLDFFLEMFKLWIKKNVL